MMTEEELKKLAWEIISLGHQTNNLHESHCRHGELVTNRLNKIAELVRKELLDGEEFWTP